MLHLFQGFGIELEYMLADAKNLNIRPLSDELLKKVSGSYMEEIEQGAFRWSNELALHVIELKTNGPASSLKAAAKGFQGQIDLVNDYLRSFQVKLLPGGMHPWMNPHLETKLWPHHQNEIYESYNQIFDCRGHGWSNLQSMHLNLPFANEAEFAKLHAAVRQVLPLMPMMAASSPYVDGKEGPWDDMRLFYYFQNQKKIPQIAGDIIPETVFSYQDYENVILKPLYQAISPYDQKNILQEEWLNSRGAITRFDRMAIELRLADVQETVWADVAIAGFFISLSRALCDEAWLSFGGQKKVPTEKLFEFLNLAAQQSTELVIDDRQFLSLFGFPDRGRIRAGELLQYLLETLLRFDNELQLFEPNLRLICEKGSLAQRLKKRILRVGGQERLAEIYEELALCLSEGRQFRE